MPYQVSPDFQAILDFSTISHQKKLRELEIESEIAMAQFKADAAKAANEAANAANANSGVIDNVRTIMDLRTELKKLDPADPIDKAVYDAVKQQLEDYGVTIA